MKKTIKALYALAIGLAFTGCMTSTGFIQVDLKTAAENGIIVTNVVDNPIFTTIEYDYSNIQNFTTNGILVTLVHNFVPEEPLNDIADSQIGVFKGIFDDVDYYNPSGYYMNSMMHLTTVEGIAVTKLPNRPAIIWENFPGKLVIASFDDIGTYQIHYDPTAK